ncbi:MAG: hypothetical protein ACJAZN_002510, partial [Planctomycetota bacterium]
MGATQVTDSQLRSRDRTRFRHQASPANKDRTCEALCHGDRHSMPTQPVSPSATGRRLTQSRPTRPQDARAIARARRARAARREARPRGPSGEEARAAARPSGEDACAASAQRHNRSSAVRRWAHEYSAVSQPSGGSAFRALVAVVTGTDLSGTELPVPTCCRRRASARRVGGVSAGSDQAGTDPLGTGLVGTDFSIPTACRRRASARRVGCAVSDTDPYGTGL